MRKLTQEEFDAIAEFIPLERNRQGLEELIEEMPGLKNITGGINMIISLWEKQSRQNRRDVMMTRQDQLRRRLPRKSRRRMSATM